MGTDFSFKEDEAGIEDVLASRGVAKFIDKASGAIAGAIKTRGPKRRSSFFGYREKIEVMPAVRTRREGLVGAVIIASPGWHLPEYGTARISATAPIRRGARDVAGVEFEES